MYFVLILHRILLDQRNNGHKPLRHISPDMVFVSCYFGHGGVYWGYISRRYMSGNWDWWLSRGFYTTPILYGPIINPDHDAGYRMDC